MPQQFRDITLGDVGRGLARYRPFILTVAAIALIAILLPGHNSNSNRTNSSGYAGAGPAGAGSGEAGGAGTGGPTGGLLAAAANGTAGTSGSVQGGRVPPMRSRLLWPQPASRPGSIPTATP
jgi:hypothetical protein